MLSRGLRRDNAHTISQAFAARKRSGEGNSSECTGGGQLVLLRPLILRPEDR
jgi:hypothetical protein